MSKEFELVRRVNGLVRRSGVRHAALWGYETSVTLRHRTRTGTRVLVNGPPKSGTHLVTDLCAAAGVMFSGRHFALHQYQREHRARRGDPPTSGSVGFDEPDRLARYLRRCPAGAFVTSHAHFAEEFVAVLRAESFTHILVFRDPRDIALSYQRHVVRSREHQYHHIVAPLSAADQIDLLVNGASAHPGLVPLREMLGAYAPWASHPIGPGLDARVHFEALRGLRGDAAQTEAFDAVLQAMGVEADHDRLRSEVGRAGNLTVTDRVSRWQDESEEVRDVLHEGLDPVAVRFGYHLED